MDRTSRKDELQMLENISFGDRVAENEADTLSTYFVETQPWKELVSGEKDIVFGSKGAGKSALYTLLLRRTDELWDRRIFVVSAEKPTGKPVFSDIATEPPTSEDEFIALWKIYLCQLIVSWLMENEHCTGRAERVADKLIEASLVHETNSLKRLISGAKRFAANLLKLESLEGSASIEGSISAKISFRPPTPDQAQRGVQSVDDLLQELNEHLESLELQCWILCDRLDVAFDQTPLVEKNALRALFKTYRDIEDHSAIGLKIFLRDDIWKRITKDGFREASHITRTTTIAWNSRNLLNLIVSRALQNPSILEKYHVSEQDILADHERQKQFYYQLFPEQVDIGERQSETFEWILSRVRDGLNNTPPRELIHYYGESVAQELREQEISNNRIEEPNIVSRAAIKSAALEVSRVKTEQTLLAEYPEHRDKILALENKKAEHTLETLSAIWKTAPDETHSSALALAEIGFFELKSAKNEKIFKVPFIYRFHLNIVQGKAS